MKTDIFAAERNPAREHAWCTYLTALFRARKGMGTITTGKRTACLLLACAAIVIAPLRFETVQAADSSFTFSVSSDVSEEDAAYVEEGITFAQHYLEEVMGDDPQIDLAINVRQTSDTTGSHATAFFSPGFMVFFTASPGWTSISAVDRIHVVVHEYVHAYQFELMGENELALPAWLIEGMAEYLSYDAVDDFGVMSSRDVHDYHSWSIASGPDMRELEMLEPRETFYSEPGPVYSLGFLAVDHFMDGRPPETLNRFMRAVGDGASWERAFADSFGVDIDDFYRSFEVARADLIAPRESPEQFRYTGSNSKDTQVRIDSTSSPVEHGQQLIVTARAEAGATCELRIRSEDRGTRINRTTFADGAGSLLWLVTIPESVAPGLAEVTATCGENRVAADVEITAPSDK